VSRLPATPSTLRVRQFVGLAPITRRAVLDYDASMSANNNGFPAPRARDIEHSRRARVAPLLAAGLSVRAISAETGISVGAVHRAKRQLEKTVAQGKQQAAAVSLELPTSYLVKQDVGGVPQDVRRLTVAVYERAVESAIGRGLLGRGDRDNPWTVVSALFAGMFDDHTIEWLNKRGYLRWDQAGQAEAIIAAVNALIGRQR
jgi:hypothetical protein